MVYIQFYCKVQAGFRGLVRDRWKCLFSLDVTTNSCRDQTDTAQPTISLRPKTVANPERTLASFTYRTPEILCASLLSIFTSRFFHLFYFDYFILTSDSDFAAMRLTFSF